MRREIVEKESKKWLNQSIITEAQREEIIALYPQEFKQNLFALFAVIFISIGILIFALSDVGFMSTIMKIILLLGISTALYLVGNHFFAREEKQVVQWRSYYGISFILIGYFFFGATLLVIIQDYHIQLFSAWPFVIWSLLGLILAYLFENKYMYIFPIIITIFSQIYSALSFSSFNYFLFILFIVGFGPLVYQKTAKSFSYFFALGLSVQLLLLLNYEVKNYYWMFSFILLMYLFAKMMRKSTFTQVLGTVSIWTILVYRMFEAFYVQDSYVFEEMTMQPSFFIVLIILLLLGLGVNWRKNRLDMMDMLLFLPVFILPFPYIWVIIILFIYSVTLLLSGYREGNDKSMRLGMASFVIATLTLYTQYAWDSLNRSLFFIIGGIIFFCLSILLDRMRKRQLEQGEDQS